MDDAELLERWNAGDRAAGERLFSRYFEALYRFFRNKVPQSCQELVQNTFAACLEKRGTLRESSGFRAFLYGIARIELLRYFRKRARSGTKVDLSLASVHELDATPSRVVVQKQEQRLLLEALRRIPVDLQIVVELHYWEGLPTAEIAEVVEIPAGTVKSRLRRAREQLLRVIEGLAGDSAVLESTAHGFDDWVSGVRLLCNPGAAEA